MAACRPSRARSWTSSPPSWAAAGHHLEKEYRFPDFRQALAFTNRIGELAEEVNHHPDIFLTWGRVRVELWTHKIDGLNEADFVWAAKADRLAS